MKKLLTFLGSIGLIATTTSPVIACTSKAEWNWDHLDADSKLLTEVLEEHTWVKIGETETADPNHQIQGVAKKGWTWSDLFKYIEKEDSVLSRIYSAAREKASKNEHQKIDELIKSIIEWSKGYSIELIYHNPDKSKTETITYGQAWGHTLDEILVTHIKDDYANEIAEHDKDPDKGKSYEEIRTEHRNLNLALQFKNNGGGFDIFRADGSIWQFTLD